jgi:anti-sigma factor RsiW
MTSIGPTDSPMTDDVEWLSMRYVLGELPEDEAVAFETRLSVDQSAREAVARAAHIVEALAATYPACERLPVRWPKLLRKLAAVVVATAAAVLIVGLLSHREADPRQVGPQRLVIDDVDPARLVVLWSETGRSLGGIMDTEVVTETVDDAAMTETASVLLPPDWMLAAVQQEVFLPPAFDPDSETIHRN